MVSSAVPSTNVIPPTPTGSAGSTGRSSNPSNECSIHSTLSSFVSAPMFNKLGLLGKITGRSSDDKETWTQWGARNLGALGGWTMHQLVCAGVSRELGELAGRLAMEKAKENPLVAVGLGTCLTAGYALRGAKALYKLATETKEESDLLNAIELSSTDPTKFSPEELAAAGRRRKFAVVAATAVNLAAGAGMAYLGYERHLDASRGAFLETVTNLVTRSHVYAIFRDGLQGMFGLVDGGSLPPTQAETRLPAAIYAFEQVIGGVTMDYVSAAISNPLYKVAARSAINAFIEALDNFQLSAVTGGKAAEESDKGIQELQHWNPTAGLTKNIFHKLFDQSITREALLHVVNASFVGIALLSEMNDKTKSPEAGVNLLQSLFINTLGAGVIGLLYGPIVSTWFWQGTQRNLDREALKRTMDDLEKASAGSGTGSGSATPPEDLQGVTVNTNQSAGTQAGGGAPAHDDGSRVRDPLAGAVAREEMTREEEAEWNRKRRANLGRGLATTGNGSTQAPQDLSAKADSATRPEMPNPDDERDINKLFAAAKDLEKRLQSFARAKAGGDTGAGMQNPLDVENESELLAEAIAMTTRIERFLNTGGDNVIADAEGRDSGEGGSNQVRPTPAVAAQDDSVIEKRQAGYMNEEPHGLWDSDASFHVSDLDTASAGPRSSRTNASLNSAGQSETTSEPDSRGIDSDAETQSIASDEDLPLQLPNAEHVSDAGALNRANADLMQLMDAMAKGMEDLLTQPLPELRDGLPEMPETDNVAGPSAEDEPAITDAEATTNSADAATSITAEPEPTPTPPPADASEPEAASVIHSANEEDPVSDDEQDLQMPVVEDDRETEPRLGDGYASEVDESENDEDLDLEVLEVHDDHTASTTSRTSEQELPPTPQPTTVSEPEEAPRIRSDEVQEQRKTTARAPVRPFEVVYEVRENGVDDADALVERQRAIINEFITTGQLPSQQEVSLHGTSEDTTSTVDSQEPYGPTMFDEEASSSVRASTVANNNAGAEGATVVQPEEVVLADTMPAIEEPEPAQASTSDSATTGYITPNFAGMYGPDFKEVDAAISNLKSSQEIAPSEVPLTSAEDQGAQGVFTAQGQPKKQSLFKRTFTKKSTTQETRPVQVEAEDDKKGTSNRFVRSIKKAFTPSKKTKGTPAEPNPLAQVAGDPEQPPESPKKGSFGRLFKRKVKDKGKGRADN